MITIRKLMIYFQTTYLWSQKEMDDHRTLRCSSYNTSDTVILSSLYPYLSPRTRGFVLPRFLFWSIVRSPTRCIL